MKLFNEALKRLLPKVNQLTSEMRAGTAEIVEFTEETNGIVGVPGEEFYTLTLVVRRNKTPKEEV